ncbi:Nuclear transport factor 2 [Collariella sp. IMI 366227]|nr:Nuclear transport factor 2 [Collariella sp. IMI 366227]
MASDQFVSHYYSTFDSDRKALASLYEADETDAGKQRENSMLTFEGAQNLGAKDIAEKLTNLPFQKVQHNCSAIDAQPTPNGGIAILVTGHLKVDDQEHPLGFSQSFQLCQDPVTGGWFVFNDLFRLVMM